MDRRQMITTTALGMGGFVIGTGFAAPACGVSKEKAVRVTGFVIDITKEAEPLLDLLGAHDLAELVRTKAIPALGKLKDALASASIPTSESALQTVRSVLRGLETALLNLPDSPRRTTIIGIIASVNTLLLTVQAFVDSEMPDARAMAPSATGASRSSANAKAIMEVFQASRQ